MDRFIMGEECWGNCEGYRMRFLRLGPQESVSTSRPPVVLIHGFLASAFSWRHSLELLARKRTVYAVDLLGTGCSDRPPMGKVSYSQRAIASRMLHWMEDVNLKNADVIGTSHGGAITMMMAALDRQQGGEKLGRLVLVDPANPYSPAGRKRIWFFNTLIGAWALRRYGPQRTGRLPRAVGEYFLRRMFANPSRINEEMRAGYNAPLQLPGTADYALSILKTWKRDMKELQKLLPTLIEVPILLIWGDRDITVSTSSSRELLRRLPQAKLVILSNTGHLPYEETSEEFNRAVLEFLDADEQCATPFVASSNAPKAC